MFGKDKAILSPKGELILMGDSAKELMQWGKWMQETERHVGDDMIKGLHVSTVFLGLDHGWGERSLWFETMIFGPRHMTEFFGRRKRLSIGECLYCWRYETLTEAKEGHAQAVEMIKAATELSGEFQLQLTYPLDRNRIDE